MVGLSFLAKMKLITHNMLSSQGMKGVKVGYPLKIEVSDKTKPRPGALPHSVDSSKDKLTGKPEKNGKNAYFIYWSC